MAESSCREYPGLARPDLEAGLAALEAVRAGLAGDLGLDGYWLADMTRSELSRETPHFPLPIVSERYAPGAGGNVAANLAALKPRSMRVLGVLGQDWRGDLLLRALAEQGAGTDAVLRSTSRVTPAYIKPIRQGYGDIAYEDPRLDFANNTPQGPDLDEAVVAGLDALVSDADVLCVSDQFPNGCITEAVRRRLVRLAQDGARIVVDSRNRIEAYPGCLLKPNELECARAVGAEPNRSASLDDLTELALALVRRTGSTVCLTLGERGCLLAEPGRKPIHVPAVPVAPPLDICGAGDSFLSLFALALAAGMSGADAAAMASLASAVTIRKLGQTGTASREEILALAGREDA
ncbi:MAG: sugar kinase [Clostridiaceae bacterium]|nr:sugar kinase [Clostridiaceae bacterium]